VPNFDSMDSSGVPSLRQTDGNEDDNDDEDGDEDGDERRTRSRGKAGRDMPSSSTCAATCKLYGP
jgi:hypothetical protein